MNIKEMVENGLLDLGYHQERDPVEEKPSVFPGGVSFRTDNTGTLKMVMASVNAVDAITIFSIWRKRTEI